MTDSIILFLYPSGIPYGTHVRPPSCNLLAAPQQESKATAIAACSRPFLPCLSMNTQPGPAVRGRRGAVPSSDWESALSVWALSVCLCLSALAAWLVWLAVWALWLSPPSILRAKRQVGWIGTPFDPNRGRIWIFKENPQKIPLENALKIGFLAPKWTSAVPEMHRKARGSQPWPREGRF